MGVGMNGIVGWNAFADIDHGAPFGEFSAELGIFLNAGGEAIKPFGHGFAGREGQRLCARIELDAGNGAGGLDHVNQRGAVAGFLAQRFIKQDDAGDVGFHRLGGAKQHLAVIAAGVGRRRRVDGFKALGDRSGAFIGGEYALAGRHHAVGNVCELVDHC